ncbi:MULTISPECIES: DUF1648 domain-containing protein [Lysinibacillus]|uniref:DUF1648 domain-containing protein n=1 Tax=Lysinibacillus boronitolerans JCM 21713 = 10a = NBRC 103108 TaxID=1294264 RepID=A0ABR4XVJ2_9BACI|nr:DUF1648 domain-containing protein [Lysinibacillus boronitolerans]KGR82387.1 hypothetical protein CD31_18275 [Lysinibacillus boronitolerans JCM 21713 = 10a = NBRC 103108]MCS1390131.1 DUF1648 domain-containing protein [Lysinibacillus boronitolerans]
MYRPILKLPKTKSEKIWDYIGGSIFILSIFYIILAWGKLPDEIPGHFNGMGEVDRWGSKIELFILPFIGLFLWIVMGLLEKAPHMHNYPSRLNESNVKAFYLNSRKILNQVKNICLILFAFISIQMVRIGLGEVNSLGWWFLPIVLIVVLIPIIKGFITSSKIK